MLVAAGPALAGHHQGGGVDPFGAAGRAMDFGIGRIIDVGEPSSREGTFTLEGFGSLMIDHVCPVDFMADVGKDVAVAQIHATGADGRPISTSWSQTTRISTTRWQPRRGCLPCDERWQTDLIGLQVGAGRECSDLSKRWRHTSAFEWFGTSDVLVRRFVFR